MAQDNGGLTHFNEQGEAHMVDVASKAVTHRSATAQGVIHMQPETFRVISTGSAKKGDVIGIARIAAIMASKKTAELVPLCHPLPLTHVEVEFDLREESSAIVCRATCETDGKTGVEMEALTAVEVGLLTIYDMCKAIDRGMVLSDIRLLDKSGGKSGHWQSAAPAPEL